VRGSYKILSLLLAIMLAGSNMTFSGHMSSHGMADSGLCALCIHQSGSDTAIVPQSFVLFSKLAADEPDQGFAPPPILSDTLFDHQSRAPPTVT